MDQPWVSERVKVQYLKSHNVPLCHLEIPIFSGDQHLILAFVDEDRLDLKIRNTILDYFKVS